MNDALMTALAELEPADLDGLADRFSELTELALDAGADAWAQVYAAIAVAAITALGDHSHTV
jgi:hypothetical protein